MAKLNPEIKARNILIESLSDKLKMLLPDVLKDTGIESVHSLNGIYGGKYAEYIDIKNEIINSAEHFISLYLEGFKAKADISQLYMNHWNLVLSSKKLQEYLYLFLKRTYIRNIDSLSKKRPKVEEAEVWIGQNNANYGLLITPRFNRRVNQWENDKSEIRHFSKLYWSIGHVLETGLLIPNKDDRMIFKTAEDYLNFFLNVIVRNSGSNYEYEIAKLYKDYVLSSPETNNILLLIPEFRYNGVANAHKYRLDFTIIDPYELTKIGFELSPWSSHGYLSKTKYLTQKEINSIASDNFEREMKKHKDFFRKHGIFVMIYTDSDLTNLNTLFSDIKKYLEIKSRETQLRFHIINDILGV